MNRLLLIFVLLTAIVTTAIPQQQAPLGKLYSRTASTLAPDAQQVFLITFLDKPSELSASSIAPGTLLSERAIVRRSKMRQTSALIDAADLPVNESYVDAVKALVVSLRHRLKWFNAVSVIATPAQIATVRTLPFVKEVELVGRWGVDRSRETENVEPAAAPSGPTGINALDYGASFTQVNQINVPALHNMGITGQGVMVGVFDNGVRLPKHQSFGSMHIVATYDFVDHKTSVVPINPSTSFGDHGVMTLSTIGGYAPGNLIGPAFGADYLLARTENDSSETPVEEDNWAAAIEWAESLGVDVTSTSLGYLTYDSPYPSWTWADMNGNATLITRAADRAVGLGVVVLNSAGNEGDNASHNTLAAPSDGDSVIAVGAVGSTGTRVYFSSVGNTTDIPNRIKPDIMAMGSGVRVASPTSTSQYTSASGTSFSCPLSAGVAALLLCANPTLTPMQVRNALRTTASQSGSPDRYMGWGIINALAAANYYGIIARGTLQGTVFLDADADGVRDGGELPMQGLMIRLSGPTTDSVFTDSGGVYSFADLGNGSYTVTIEVTPGWNSSTPPSSQYTATLASFDTTVANLNFGLYQFATVHGIVYDDQNHNGTRDGLEPGLAGWQVALSGGATLQTTTDTGGAYSFGNLEPGSYTTNQIPGPDWVQMFPAGSAPHTFGFVGSGGDVSGNFGMYQVSQATYGVNEGWNLLSLPREVADRSVQSVYPGAAGRAYTYELGFHATDTLPGHEGYWIKFSNAHNVAIDGFLRFDDTVAVKTGWNVIGTGSFVVPVSNIIQSPPGNVTSDFFKFDGEYSPVTQLEPHAGYWVKVQQDGTLILPSGTAAPNR